jgi:hypothetical protein
MLIHRDPFSMISTVREALSASNFFSRVSLLIVTGKFGVDLNLNNDTTYRFLTTCFSLKGIHPNSEPGKYSLGSKIVWFTRRFFESINFRGISRSLADCFVIKSREVTAKIVGVDVLPPNPIQDFQVFI